MTHTLRYRCRGPVVGVYTETDVAAGHCSTDQLGHIKRGLARKKTIKPGAASLESGSQGVVVQDPVIDEVNEPCNYDLTPLIEAVPAGAGELIVTCPRCGNEARIHR